MTRYPVHVGSIPAYQLAEMDRINEPYRKERAMASPDPVSEPVDGLREAIDAVADALNGWDQGEEPREDTHRHWSRIVAALAAAPAEDHTHGSRSCDPATCEYLAAARQSGDPR